MHLLGFGVECDLITVDSTSRPLSWSRKPRRPTPRRPREGKGSGGRIVRDGALGGGGTRAGSARGTRAADGVGPVASDELP